MRPEWAAAPAQGEAGGEPERQSRAVRGPAKRTRRPSAHSAPEGSCEPPSASARGRALGNRSREASRPSRREAREGSSGSWTVG